MKNKFILSLLYSSVMLLGACSQNKMTPEADAALGDSVAVADTTNNQVLSSIFGPIPDIYEKEMIAITEAARRQTNDSSIDAIRGAMANMADSAYKVAEEKAIPQAVKMIDAQVKYSVEEGLDYQILSDLKVLSTLLPELKSCGGEQRVAVQLMVKAGPAKDAYYVLRGEKGAIATASFKWPQPDSTFTTTIMIHAPNIPAQYQEACSELQFVTKSTYLKVKSEVERKQNIWRETYKDMHGL